MKIAPKNPLFTLEGITTVTREERKRQPDTFPVVCGIGHMANNHS